MKVLDDAGQIGRAGFINSKVIAINNLECFAGEAAVLKKELVSHLYAVKKEGARVAAAESMACSWVKHLAAINPGQDGIFCQLRRAGIAQGRILADLPVQD